MIEMALLGAAGAGLGALMNKKGQASSKQVQTQTAERNPWGPAATHLQTGLDQAGNLYNNRLSQTFFPGQTYANFAPETEGAFSRMTQRAADGSPLNRNAQGMVNNSLTGRFLSAGNPYFQQMAGRVTQNVLPAITAQWARAGRGTGNGEVVEAASRGLGDAIGQLAYQNYGDERSRQFQAAGMAPGLAREDYYDMDRLRSVGAEREAQAQRGIDEARARWDFEQNKQANALKEYMGFTMPVAGMGGTSSSTGTAQTNPSMFQSMLGMGMMGASLGQGYGGGGGAGLGMSAAAPMMSGSMPAGGYYPNQYRPWG